MIDLMDHAFHTFVWGTEVMEGMRALSNVLNPASFWQQKILMQSGPLETKLQKEEDFAVGLAQRNATLSLPPESDSNPEGRPTKRMFVAPEIVSEDAEEG